MPRLLPSPAPAVPAIEQHAPEEQHRGFDRRDFLLLASGAVITGGAYTAGVISSPAQAAAPGTAPTQGSASASVPPSRQFRGLWIATVSNIDFPSKPGLSVAAQKKEFEALLDMAVTLHLNAVISQVRPAADAFWPSKHEPWSQVLTATQGKNPGYDPLAFQVKAAHARNLEFHAWFNPYRVANHTSPSRLVASHPARKHPEWVFAYGSKLYYNPGIPAVRRFVEDAMLDAVTRYDIDAVHFDDYFYPYPIDGKAVPDQKAFAAYGKGRKLADWRRDNVNALVREMRERIRAVKPWVKFGVSPFGIWRNRSSDSRGSATGGTESYSAIYADTRLWVTKGWIDYIAPQIYWQIGLKVADYAELVRWWSKTVAGTGVALYIGQAVYKYNDDKPTFTDPAELSRHLTLNRSYAQIGGDIHFSASDVRRDTKGAISRLVRDHYAHPAIVPAISKVGGKAPKTPTGLKATRTSKGLRLRFTRSSSRGAVSYAVWRLPSASASAARLADGRRLVATFRADSAHRVQEYIHVKAPKGGFYAVTAYDRRWNQSKPSKVVKG